MVPTSSARLFLARLTVVAAVVSALAVGVPLLLRGMTYRGATHWVEGWPDAARTLLAGVADVGLLVVVGAYVGTLALRRRDRVRVLVGLVAGASAVVAYAASEVVKLVVTEQRPCITFAVPTAASCPPGGDWSWPSNHATIAAALATATVLVAPRAWRLVVPAALAVAAARVLVGVHYVHDVTAGLILGASVVTVLTLVAGPRLLARLPGLRPA